MMNPRKIVLEQIRHHETNPIPYRILFEPDVEERITKYYGNDSWREKLVTYLVPCCKFKSRKEYPVIREEEPLEEGMMRDLFGSIWRTDVYPRHLERPALTSPSFDRFDFPKAGTFVEPGMKQNALKNLRENPGVYSYIDLRFGLWEFSWGMRGYENALMDCVAEPDFYAELLDRFTDMCLSRLDLCKDIPADAFKFSDDWGAQHGVLIGPERWRQFFKPRYARLYEKAHAQGKTVISHCCGSVADIMPDLIEIGLDVLESVQPEAKGMNPYELKKNWGDKITFWGCLGSQSVIPFGNPDEIRAEIAKLRRIMGKGGGYILAPAKRILSDTPIENAVAVIEAFTNG